VGITAGCAAEPGDQAKCTGRASAVFMEGGAFFLSPFFDLLGVMEQAAGIGAERGKLHNGYLQTCMYRRFL